MSPAVMPTTNVPPAQARSERAVKTVNKNAAHRERAVNRARESGDPPSRPSKAGRLVRRRAIDRPSAARSGYTYRGTAASDVPEPGSRAVVLIGQKVSKACSYGERKQASIIPAPAEIAWHLPG